MKVPLFYLSGSFLATWRCPPFSNGIETLGCIQPDRIMASHDNDLLKCHTRIELCPSPQYIWIIKMQISGSSAPGVTCPPWHSRLSTSLPLWNCSLSPEQSANVPQERKQWGEAGCRNKIKTTTVMMEASTVSLILKLGIHNIYTPMMSWSMHLMRLHSFSSPFPPVIPPTSISWSFSH